MNKLLKTISLFLIAVFSAGLLMVSSTQAVQLPLDVEFENDPLFSNIDLKPGDNVTRWVKVTNNSGETKPVAFEAINYPDPIPSDDLSRALMIVIKKGGTDLYGPKSLYDFYLDGETFLSNINNGETIQYDFTVSFPSEKGNEWQNTTTYFDILVGFQGEDGGTGGGNGGNGGTSGSISGGGTTLPPGLTILDESVRIINITENSATIIWTTSYFSTSQVIYAAEGESYGFDLGQQNYGYPHAAPVPEDALKVTAHSVTITGLASNTTYYFRCVSHASPPTISRQFNFKTLTYSYGEEPSFAEVSEGKEEEGGEIVISPEGPIEEGIEEEEETGTEEGDKIIIGPEGQVITEEAGESEQETLRNFFANLLADISDALKDFLGKCFPYLPWLIILALAFLLIRKYFSKEKNIKGDIGFILGLLIILILFVLWLVFKCLPVWLVLLSLIAYFFGADFLKRKTKKSI